MRDVLDFALSRLDEPHRHHQHCVHNMSYEEQMAQRKRNGPGGRPWTDEEMRLFRLDEGIVVITPDDWEEDVPELDWSRLQDASE
jgi:hypothetical protein